MPPVPGRFALTAPSDCAGPMSGRPGAERRAHSTARRPHRASRRRIAVVHRHLLSARARRRDHGSQSRRSVFDRLGTPMPAQRRLASAQPTRGRRTRPRSWTSVTAPSPTQSRASVPVPAPDMRAPDELSVVSARGAPTSGSGGKARTCFSRRSRLVPSGSARASCERFCKCLLASGCDQRPHSRCHSRVLSAKAATMRAGSAITALHQRARCVVRVVMTVPSFVGHIG